MTRAWRRWVLWLAPAAAALLPASASGGTRVEPKVLLTLEERYDDDTLLRTEDTVVLGGELMTKVTPQVGGTLQSPTTTGELFYAPDLQLRHLSGTFRVDHRAGLDLEARLSRRQGVFAELRLWRVADPTSLPRMGVGRTLSPVLYGTAEVGTRAQLARRVLSTFRYRFEGTRIYEPGWPSGQVHAPTAEVWYRLSARTSLGGEYRFQYFLFGPDQALAHSPVASVRHRLTRQTTVEMRAGPVWFNSISEETRGWAPRVHLQLTHHGRHADVGLQVGQELVGATGFTSALWAQYVGVHAEWRPGRPLRLFGAAYGFRNGGAPGALPDYLGMTRSAQNGYAVALGVEWRLDERFGLQAQVDRIAQVGALGPGADLSRNIASVRLVVTPF